MQFTARLAWILAFAITYHLNIDGMTLPLILDTSASTGLENRLFPSINTGASPDSAGR